MLCQVGKVALVADINARRHADAAVEEDGFWQGLYFLPLLMERHVPARPTMAQEGGKLKKYKAHRDSTRLLFIVLPEALLFCFREVKGQLDMQRRLS